MLFESCGFAAAAPMPARGPAFYDGGPAPAIPDSLWQWLTHKARLPGKLESTALISFHQDADHLSNLSGSTPQGPTSDYLQWTYAELIAAAETLAAYLETNGVTRGDVVLTFVDNVAEWVVLLWASVRIGAVLASQDPVLLNRRDELQSVIASIQPKAVLVQNTLEAAKFKSQSKSWPCAVQLVCRGNREQLLEDWRLMSEVRATSTFFIPIPVLEPEETAIIQYSSGSTNQPKGCPHTLRSIVSSIEGYRSFYDSQWTADGTTFVLTSPTFVSGCYLGCLNTFSAAGCVVIPESDFYAESTLAAIHDTKATHLMLVPSQLRALLSSPDTSMYRPSTLKLIIVSGDAVSEDLIEKARSELRPGRIALSWSMSEGGPVFGWQHGERIQSYNHIPMVGRPLPGSRVKVCIAGSDEAANLGEIGDLHVSSSSMIDEYVHGLSPDVFYYDGSCKWFVTGDLAVMEDNGAVSVVGRSKDIIRCSGWALLPSIIEDYIKEFFGIESQAIGVPSSATGEKPVAVIKVRKASADLKQEMKQGLSKHSGSEYTLGAVYLLSELGLKDWPLGQTQKVSKSDLKSAVLRNFPTKPVVNAFPFSMYDMAYLEDRVYGF